MRNLILGTVLFLVVFSAIPASGENGFTQKDREMLIELRVKMIEVDKRFDQVDKRFDQVDKRFDQVDTRISELREDMNKRFEDVNARFEDMFHFFYILTGIFTSLVVVVIGFAYWDRRTMIKEARKEAIDFIEKEGILRRLLDAFRELSLEDSKLAGALKRFNLL